MSENPYAPPTAHTGPPAINLGQPTAESIRRLHLKHEASVKSIGTLYFLGGLILIGTGFIPMLSAGKEEAMTIPIGIGLVVLGLLQLWLAVGIRKLKRGAKIPAIILSVIGLIGIPIGTLISVYFLYLLCSQKGTMVFSDEYARVIAETPHIKYKTSIFVWILLALLLALLAFGIFMA